ncbi:MAG: ROK family protein [Gemmatimonadetes bacterium]|nr:ROK family protein [Gemmatimonadota bacterium]
MSARRVIAVDLGGTNWRIAQYDETGKCLAKTRIRAVAEKDPEAGLAQLADAIVVFIEEQKGAPPPQAVGVGSPGPISVDRSVVMEAPNLPTWHHVPVRTILETLLGLPVRLENDANLAALGEFSFGAGRDADSLLMVTLGTGIGGGFVSGGRLWTGAHGAAMEIGHTYVGGDVRCGCGAVGCIEEYASGPGIARLYAERTGQSIDSYAIFEKREAGEADAVHVIETASRILGMGLVSWQKILDPEQIVVSGGLSAQWKAFVEPAIVVANENDFESWRGRIRVTRALLGGDAGIAGAALLALDTSA